MQFFPRNMNWTFEFLITERLDIWTCGQLNLSDVQKITWVQLSVSSRSSSVNSFQLSKSSVSENSDIQKFSFHDKFNVKSSAV